MIDIKSFGQRLSELRRNADLKQQDVAEKCFVSIQAVSKWERGQSCPDLLILDDLALALGVKIKDLFGEN
ncbi:MAG: helix-turn-helix transcriptional regulator [Clostridia bacterium]|nr:helix-turn-helix transcriptional regulator [Clostridia bacterium]MBR3862337.1 helix-turn-helix transcriptional regulator [Clostridia bacterium]